jgi:hypothetical protein
MAPVVLAWRPVFVGKGLIFVIPPHGIASWKKAIEK